MKRILIAVFFAVVLILGAIFFITRHAQHSSRVAELVPADTIAFFHLPDVARTRERWMKTALHQIGAEPEVQAFLQRPKSKIPQHDEIQRQLARMGRIEPQEAFAAVTAMAESNVPKFVVGFSYRGKKAEVEAMLAELRKALQSSWPAGKADIFKAGGDEIETFTNAGATGVAAFKENWLLMGNDVDLMKATLARFEGRGANALRDNADFRAAVSRMPIDFDALSFVEMAPIMDRLRSLVVMTNPMANPAGFEELKKVRAFAGAAKLEGENIRETLFTLKPGEAKKEPLKRDALAMTSADTLLYYAGRMQKPANFQMPNPALDATGMMRGLQSFLDAFTAEGLTADDFWKAFGPETSLVADWPAISQAPAPIVALEVQDRAAAQRFVDALTQPKSGPAWARQVIDGTQFNQLPPTGFGFFQVNATVAVTDKFVLAGLSLEAVKTALARLKTGEGKLNAVPAFRDAAEKVQAPSTAFGYVNARGLFERIYSPLRPLAMMWAGFAKGSSDYVEIGKMPATETISKHLGPIVYSQNWVDDGMISESVGPVTMTQAMFAVGLGAGAAAVPLLQKQLHPTPTVATPPAMPVSSPGVAPALPLSIPAATPSPITTP